MKLLSKTSLLIITASIFIFWLGNIAFFFVTRQMINNQINSDLMTQMAGVMTRLNKGEISVDLLNNFEDLTIENIPVDEFHQPAFRDTVIYNNSQQAYIAHRALSFTVNSPDGTREITIYKSLLSSDKLIERITLSSIILLIAFIVMIYILNRYIFTNVWSNFARSLQKLDEYDFTNPDSLELPGSEIEEFDKLNHVLLEMAERIQADYRNLKELTANTSHEIQTPLAIIKSKAEILLQSENLKESEVEIIDSILTTTARLSKLNQSLLLIAKIENNQFREAELINLGNALERYVDNLDLLYDSGSFRIKSELADCSVYINPVLLDVLISNLLKNALTHGKRGGVINIELNNCLLKVTNEGEPFPFSSDQLFKRFIKGSNRHGSTGIGLEIVRKICNYYHLSVNHEYIEKTHTFSVNFEPLVNMPKMS